MGSNGKRKGLRKGKRGQPVCQSRKPSRTLFISHSHLEGSFFSNQNHQFSPSGDSGVEQVALQKHELLTCQRDHHCRKLAALGFMNRDGIGELQLVEFAGLVIHPLIAVEGDNHVRRLLGDLGDMADISVEDFLFVVIPGLDHLVAGAEDGTEAFDLEFKLGRRIEGLLEQRVQFGGAKRLTIHWSEHLDVIPGIEVEALRNALLHEAMQRFANGIGVAAFDEKEIGISGVFEWGNCSLIHIVGRFDDTTGFALTVDASQSGHGGDSAVEDIPQDAARTDGGKLVHIAYEEDMSVLGDGIKQLCHELDIDHGGFVDDKEITYERLVLVAGETVFGLVFEGAVNGKRFATGRIVEPLGGAAGGGAEDGLDLLGREDFEDRIEDGGFPNAGTTGNDGETMPGCLDHSFGLFLAELKLVMAFKPGNGLFGLDFGKGDLSRHQLVKALGHFCFGSVKFGGEDQWLAVGVFDNNPRPEDELAEGPVDGLHGGFENVDCFLDQLVAG